MTEPLEEILSKSEPALRKWLTKAILYFLSVCLPLLPLLLPENSQTLILIPLCVLSLLLATWILSKWASRGLEIRQLADALKEKPSYYRQLYWLPNDPIPFCPHCYENEDKLLHLSGPLEVWSNEEIEAWNCDVCSRDYHAKPGQDFERRKTK